MHKGYNREAIGYGRQAIFSLSPSLGGGLSKSKCLFPGREGLPKSPLPWREGMKGRGIITLFFHPHPGPLPSRERVIFSLFCHCSNIDDSV